MDLRSKNILLSPQSWALKHELLDSLLMINYTKLEVQLNRRNRH
jgi:hypothetical protein